MSPLSSPSLPLHTVLTEVPSFHHLRIPIGISATLISFTSPLGRYVSRKYLILAGHVLAIVGTILLVFADTPERYWRFAFPGLILGSAGAMVTYMHVRYVPRRFYTLSVSTRALTLGML